MYNASAPRPTIHSVFDKLWAETAVYFDDAFTKVWAAHNLAYVGHIHGQSGFELPQIYFLPCVSVWEDVSVHSKVTPQRSPPPKVAPTVTHLVMETFGNCSHSADFWSVWNGLSSNTRSEQGHLNVCFTAFFGPCLNINILEFINLICCLLPRDTSACSLIRTVAVLYQG